MKTADPVRPIPPDDSDWPFAVSDVDDVLARIEQKAKRRKVCRRRLAGGTALFAAVALAAAWAVPFLRDTASVATVAAHRQSLTLADGTAAELNAQTRVHTDFRYGRRIVQLTQGEAFFAVAKDPAHPFLVETPAGTIRVTGTQFNVRLDGDHAEVTLLEGAVTVERRGTALGYLAPGEQLTTDGTAPAVRRLDPAALDDVLAWRDGRFVLDGLTLGQAVQRLAAYHGRQIDVAPAVATLPTGGAVSLDNLDAALAALQEALPIRLLSLDGGNFRIVARP